MRNAFLFAIATLAFTGCALHPAAMVVPFLGFVIMIAILTLIVHRWGLQAQAEAEGESDTDDEEELFFEQLPTHEELMARYPKTNGDETSI
jgi:hypothetical protein